ncbi:MAG: hypothetical protein OXF25_00415 [Cyanobacteria bacterium MAG CAR3_bin_5]|nr:hypothetical protein [Cyanobacteria bacterium MAG CAR3_bin_5]
MTGGRQGSLLFWPEGLCSGSRYQSRLFDAQRLAQRGLRQPRP